MIYWLTGQPGAGKTTLATWIMASYPNKGVHIDGDDMRNCYQDKDYSKEGRMRNVEKAQNIARFLHYKGNTVVVSFVSPYKEQREEFKQLIREKFLQREKERKEREVQSDLRARQAIKNLLVDQ